MNSLPHDTAAGALSDDDHPVIADLKRALAQLEARVAQLEQLPAQWLPLKAATYDAGVEYETARVWAKRGLIEARRDGKRWFANLVSLKARKQLLAR